MAHLSGVRSAFSSLCSVPAHFRPVTGPSAHRYAGNVCSNGCANSAPPKFRRPRTREICPCPWYCTLHTLAKRITMNGASYNSLVISNQGAIIVATRLMGCSQSVACHVQANACAWTKGSISSLNFSANNSNILSVVNTRCTTALRHDNSSWQWTDVPDPLSALAQHPRYAISPLLSTLSFSMMKHIPHSQFPLEAPTRT
jgi:hypothetical protein